MASELFKNYAYAAKAITHETYDYIYISPHFDDVAFSCSGTLCSHKAHGFDALVVTLFAGDAQPPFSPFAQSCHQLWQIPEGVLPYQVRRAEDEKAMEALGVDYVWLNWPELIYRDPDLSDFRDISGYNADLRSDSIFPKLRQWFVDLCAMYTGATIVVPLSVGGHRDHRLIFQVTLDVLNHAKLLFFEDFPYAAYLPEETMELVRSYNLVPLEVDISDCLEQRIDVASFYQSQHSMLFYPPSSFREMIKEYAHKADMGTPERFVERYWRFSQ